MKTGITLKNKDIRGFAAESALFWVRAMFSQAAGTREGKDIEHLHDMRVASRRLRECFRVFNAFYAPRKLKKVLSSVRNITRVLGRPRETDVNLSLLAAYQPGPSPILSTTHEYLLEIFEFEQARQRRKMLKQVGKIDRGALENMLSRFAETARTSRSRPSLLTQVGQELEFEGFLSISTRDLRQNVAKIFAFEAAPSGEEYEARLHELRINTKKLRYRLELLNAAYDQRFGGGIRLAKDLQDVIGWAHDYSVLIVQLESHRRYLTQKGRMRLARGCQRTIADFDAIKASYLDRVQPARIGFLQELSRLDLAPENHLLPVPGRIERQAMSG
ncbi:MAG: CHAD domain-containing protein [Acidobacteriota bacterium]|nr:CHAD domain-containing protein [Acidobacteriota bacterium]